MMTTTISKIYCHFSLTNKNDTKVSEGYNLCGQKVRHTHTTEGLNTALCRAINQSTAWAIQKHIENMDSVGQNREA